MGLSRHFPRHRSREVANINVRQDSRGGSYKDLYALQRESKPRESSVLDSRQQIRSEQRRRQNPAPYLTIAGAPTLASIHSPLTRVTRFPVGISPCIPSRRKPTSAPVRILGSGRGVYARACDHRAAHSPQTASKESIRKRFDWKNLGWGG